MKATMTMVKLVRDSDGWWCSVIVQKAGRTNQEGKDKREKNETKSNGRNKVFNKMPFLTTERKKHGGKCWNLKISCFIIQINPEMTYTKRIDIGRLQMTNRISVLYFIIIEIKTISLKQNQSWILFSVCCICLFETNVCVYIWNGK